MIQEAISYREISHTHKYRGGSAPVDSRTFPQRMTIWNRHPEFCFCAKRCPKGTQKTCVSLLLPLDGCFIHKNVYLCLKKHPTFCLLRLLTLYAVSVFSRWEMQKDAELEDGEKTMVEELKKAYFVCCCCSSSLGVQDPPEADEAPVKQTQGETQDSHGSVAR